MARPRAWLCWSSGKDSAWALHVVRQQGELDVVGLLTTVTEPYDRVSMHGVRVEVLEAQAEAAGLPLVRVPIPAPCPNGAYEESMRRAIDRATAEGISQMVFGDLHLEDVREYRQKQLAPTGITPVFPLWQRATGELAVEMIGGGLTAYVACLDPARLPVEMAGSAFDEAFLARLPADVDPCAERGEFHTCVTGGPMFDRAIAVEVGRTVRRDGFVFTDLSLSAT